MSIHLVADWRRVLSRAWSMRLVYLAVTVLMLAEVGRWAREVFYLPPIWSLLLRLAGVALMIAGKPVELMRGLLSVMKGLILAPLHGIGDHRRCLPRTGA